VAERQDKSPAGNGSSGHHMGDGGY
jgi:hypothetical protein